MKLNISVNLIKITFQEQRKKTKNIVEQFNFRNKNKNNKSHGSLL